MNIARESIIYCDLERYKGGLFQMTQELSEYQKIGQKIEEMIRPSTFPLAIKMIKSEDEIQFRYKSPSTDLHLQNFVCQNFKMSRTYGWTMVLTEKDINCKLARSIYGWDPITKENDDQGNAFMIGLYAKNLETSKKTEQHIYRLDSDFQGMVISPLCRTKVVPDVVLIYCLPAQAMRFIQGYLYSEGGVLEFTAAGRMGSCHEGVVKSIVTNKPQLVILGNGDRIWGGAQDSEVMFACPHDQLDVLMEGLETTHAAGLRYPIPAYMNFTPGFQESFEKEAVRRAGGTFIKK